MMSLGIATQQAIRMVELGEIQPSDANAEIVRMMGVRLVVGKIPAQVRRDLNAAVKAGRLGHLKKDGLMPEAFFHPNSKANAISSRRQAMNDSVGAISKVCI